MVPTKQPTLVPRYLLPSGVYIQEIVLYLYVLVLSVYTTRIKLWYLGSR